MKLHVLIALIVIIETSVASSAQTSSQSGALPRASAYLDAIGGLTLEQAIAQAIEAEPELRAERSNVDVARGMRVQAGVRPNPAITVAQQFEPAGTDSQTRVDVQWPLDLFRKTGRVNVAEREIEAAQFSLVNRERLLASDVRLKYGEVAALVRELSISDEVWAATASHLELVSARVAEGVTPPLERNILQVELQRLSADRLLQANHLERAVLELKRLLGLPSDAGLRIRDDLERVVRQGVALQGGVAVRERADVSEAETRLRIADARIDQARRDGRFDATVMAMYMRNDTGFPQRGFGPNNELEPVRGLFHYFSAGLMVTIPVRDRNQGVVAVAQAQRNRAAAQVDASRLTMETEIAAARTRDERARQALGAFSREVVDLAKQNLDVVSQSYELGRMTLLEVLTERRRFLEVERAYTSALREAWEARQALLRAVGEVR